MVLVIASVSLSDPSALVPRMMTNGFAGNRHGAWNISLKRGLAAADRGPGRHVTRWRIAEAPGRRLQTPRNQKPALKPSPQEHRAEKWAPVFSFSRCDNKNLEQAGRF
jgi:hypothetical protein